MKRIKHALSLVVLAVLASLNTSIAAAAGEVGTVSKVSGEAYAISAFGERRTLTEGSAVHEGDTIETVIPEGVELAAATNGLVLITADGAVWSLSRASRMEIAYYQLNDAGTRKAGAQYRVHTGSLTYDSGSLKSKAVVQLDDTTLTPLGTTLRFETISGVTLGKVTNGRASYTKPDGSTGIINNGQYVLRDSTGKISVYPNAWAARADLVRALMAVARTTNSWQGGAGLKQQTGTAAAQAANWGFASVETFARWMMNEVTYDIAAYTASTSGSRAGQTLLPPTQSIPSSSGGGGGGISVASPN